MVASIPCFSEFEARYIRGESQLCYQRIAWSSQTVVGVASVFSDETYLAVLESVERGIERSRFSSVILGARELWRYQEQKIAVNDEVRVANGAQAKESLKAFIDAHQVDLPEALPPSSYGVFGYMGYDMVRLIEHIPDTNPDNLAIADSVFFAPKATIVFDAQEQCIYVSICCTVDERSAQDCYNSTISQLADLVQKISDTNDAGVTNVDSVAEVAFDAVATNMDEEEFKKMVLRAKEYIVAGDIFQVVLSQRFTTEFNENPFDLYCVLRHINPSPYSFYMKLDGYSLVGSSPEILVRVTGDKVMVRPIAGTRWRGANAQEDRALEQELLADQKELSEHLMLLDLGRNDIGRVAEVGTVAVTEQMVVEHYSHVMHIVSHVEGRIESGHALDAWFAGFPAGTVSGAPKVRAMEIIDELENLRRSFYAGGVGYFSANGDMDSCITLRTGLIKDGQLHVQAGGGVVADSDPKAEYQESCNKAKAVLAAAQIVKG